MFPKRMNTRDRFEIMGNFLEFFAEEYRDGNPELQKFGSRAKWMWRNLPKGLFIPFARVPVGLEYYMDEDED